MAVPKPLSTWEILWEGIKLPTRNWGLMLPILLLNILFSSLLSLINYLSLKPPLQNLFANFFALATTAPDSPELFGHFFDVARRDVAELIIIEIVFFVVAFFVTSLLSIATITAAASIWTMNHITLKELFTMVIKSWKGPTTTKLFIAALSYGFMILIFPLLVLVVIAFHNSATFIALALALALVLVYVYVRLEVVWVLGFVVSVVEEGCHGAVAIARAGELIKGRRRQGMIITFLMMLVIAPIAGVYIYLNPFIARGAVSSFAIVFVAVGALAYWGIVVSSTYTVIYYDCRESNGKEMVHISEKFGYTKMAAAEVDTDLP